MRAISVSESYQEFNRKHISSSKDLHKTLHIGKYAKPPNYNDLDNIVDNLFWLWDEKTEDYDRSGMEYYQEGNGEINYMKIFMSNVYLSELDPVSISNFFKEVKEIIGDIKHDIDENDPKYVIIKLYYEWEWTE